MVKKGTPLEASDGVKFCKTRTSLPNPISKIGKVLMLLLTNLGLLRELIYRGCLVEISCLDFF